MEFEIQQDGSHIVIRNQPDDTIFDTSLANAIKRAVLDTSLTYSFSEQLEKEDAAELNQIFKTELNEDDDVLFTVDQCNFDNLQKLSHRLSRTPIYYSDETQELLDSIYVMLVSRDASGKIDDYKKPYFHTEDVPFVVHSRDLSVVRVTTNDAGETILTELEAEDKEKLFPYNVHLFNIQKGNYIHFIAKPVKGYGYEDSMFSPCPVRYSFVSTSAERDSVKHDREWDVAGNKLGLFGNPKQIEIVFEENGKKDVKLAVIDGIQYLINQLELFKMEYAKPDSEIVKKEKSVAGSQIVHVFNMPDDDDDREVNYLADHTVCNILASHILYEVYDTYFKIAGADIEKYINWIESTKVSFRKPHPYPRVVQMEIHLQMPDDVEIYTEFGVERNLSGLYHRLYDIVIDKITGYLRMQLAVIESF